jgi:predicted TIM-barrel fold metal-dependent hydrolase
LTAGLQLAKKLRPAGCPPARRHHLVSPGDIISESAGDFVGICNLARAAADFPDLNFIAFHSAFPWEAEFVAQAKAVKVKNIYAELGSLARMMRTDPARYSVLLGNLLDGFGADHILRTTDASLHPVAHMGEISDIHRFTQRRWCHSSSPPAPQHLSPDGSGSAAAAKLNC